MAFYEDGDFITKPFANKKGVFFIIVDKKTRKDDRELIPFTTNTETMQRVKRRVKELIRIDSIKFAREMKVRDFKRKARSTSKSLFSFAKAAKRELQNFNKAPRKKRVKRKKKVVKRKKRSK